MSTHTLLISLFKYKARADAELCDALARFPANAEQERFETALRILNHAHIVDRIFIANVQRKPHDITANRSAAVPVLTELATAIYEADQWFLTYLAETGQRDLEEVVDFVFTDGGQGCMSREEMLAHVIAHGGYHRGEIGRLLPEVEEAAMRDVFAGFLHRAEPQRRKGSEAV